MHAPSRHALPGGQGVGVARSRHVSPSSWAQALGPPPSGAHTDPPRAGHSSVHDVEQVPSLHDAPAGHATTAPHSRHASASVSPQVRTPSAMHSVAPFAGHSSSQVAAQEPATQVSPGPHATGGPRSRHASASNAPHARVASPEQALSPATHSSVHGAAAGTHAPCSQRYAAGQATAPPPSRHASAS